MFEYFRGAINTFMILAGMAGKEEHVTVDKAIEYLDAGIKKIEQVVRFELQEEDINEAKLEIIGCSSDDDMVSIADAASVVRTLEQKVRFGYPNRTLPLPHCLSHLAGIYNFVAYPVQRDNYSCGHRTLSETQALDQMITLNKLDLDEINDLSCSNLPSIIGQREPTFLKSQQINSFALKVNVKEEPALNEHEFPTLLEGLIDENSQVITGNKLHILSMLAENGDITPDFLSGAAATVKSKVIKTALGCLNESNNITELNDYLNAMYEISQGIVLDDVNLEKQKKFIGKRIDWEYLNGHMDDQGFELEMKEAIIKCIADKGSDLIDLDELDQFVKRNKGCLDGVDLDWANYKNNNHLLTFLNLAFIETSCKNFPIFEEYNKNSLRYKFFYFKTLYDYFNQLKTDNRAGALHFACNLPGHWILISVIHLEDQEPFLVMVDSLNKKIQCTLPFQEHQTMEELYNLISAQPLNWDRFKMLYLLFLYHLFINGKYLINHVSAEGETSKISVKIDGVNLDEFGESSNTEEIHRVPPSSPDPSTSRTLRTGEKGKEKEI